MPQGKPHNFHVDLPAVELCDGTSLLGIGICSLPLAFASQTVSSVCRAWLLSCATQGTNPGTFPSCEAAYCSAGLRVGVKLEVLELSARALVVQALGSAFRVSP